MERLLQVLCLKALVAYSAFLKHENISKDDVFIDFIPLFLPEFGYKLPKVKTFFTLRILSHEFYTSSKGRLKKTQLSRITVSFLRLVLPFSSLLPGIVREISVLFIWSTYHFH